MREPFGEQAVAQNRPQQIMASVECLRRKGSARHDCFVKRTISMEYGSSSGSTVMEFGMLMICEQKFSGVSSQ